MENWQLTLQGIASEDGIFKNFLDHGEISKTRTSTHNGI
jgi:hypothetical protein